MQIGRLQQTNTVTTTAAYPLPRPGLARQGLDVYRANGCIYCHSQQIGQTGAVCDVLLTEVTTNQAAVIEAAVKIKPSLSKSEPKEILAALPMPILQGVSRQEADRALKPLKEQGAKAELWVRAVGPDIARGWGNRRTVAYDYLFDYPVMLGSQRVGPDLVNVGLRLPDPNWHFLHLYAPRLEIKDSTMPPYRFLFEKRRIERAPSPDALSLPGALAPAQGYEIVPKPEARALVAYLVNLRADAPLYVAPLTVPAAPASASETNAPAADGLSTPNAPPTNAPAK